MSKELLNLKRASLDLLEQRGFDTFAEERLREKMFDDDIELFRDLYINDVPKMKDNKMVQFFEQEKINPNYQFRQYMSSYYPLKGSNSVSDGCVVYFAAPTDNKKVSKDDVSCFCRLIEFFKVTNGIIISKTELPQNIEEICLEYIPCRIKKTSGVSYGCFIQHYLDQELYFNPLNHVMVPKHRILSLEEVEASKLKSSQLPVISALDPIAKRLGARANDVIEITRKSMISKTTVITEEEISYRVVKVPPKAKKK